MNKSRKLFIDSLFVFSFSILATFLGYLIRVVLSKKLSLEEFGLFYAVFTFIVFFNIFRDFGLSQTLAKFIPDFLVKKQYSKLKSAIYISLIFNLISSIIFVLVLLLLSKFLALNYFRNYAALPLIYYFCVYFIFASLYDVLTVCFLGFQSNKLYSLKLFFVNLFVFLGIIVFDKGITTPALSYMIAVIIGTIIAGIVLFRKFDFLKHPFVFDKKLVILMFSFAFALLLTMFGNQVIYYIDTLILTYFVPLSDVGIYNVILPSANLFFLIGSSIGLVLLPLISELISRKDKKYISFILRLIYKYVYLLSFPLIILVFVFSEFFIRLMFGVNFLPGAKAFRILIVGAFFFTLAIINIKSLVGIGKPKIIAKIILSVALFNFLFNLIIIPYLGIVGAALTTSISYFLMLILSSYYLSKIIKIMWPVRDWFKTFAANFIFLLILYIVRDKLFNASIYLKLTVGLLLSFLIYFLLLIFFRVISFKEIKKIVKVIFKKELKQ
jgi:O-antigen/teichoic acid export membrane protein